MLKNINIIKSSFDHKKYDVFELSNKLKVILIEDSEAILDDVIMGVGVGYMYDTVNGIAHFLEHMLFIGNKKYPKLNYFTNFIKQHGGKTNAYTAHDHTCFYYSIQSDILTDSMDVFSRFFIDPTFDKQYVDKEINAVNEEHMKNIDDDSWRYEDIIKEVCEDNHAYSKFGTGNLETLKIDNIHEKLLDFYNNYYSSDNMILIIRTSKKNNKIKPDIIKIFSEIPFKKTLKYSQDGMNVSGPIIKKNIQINMLPLKSIDTFSVLWDIENNAIINFFIYLMSNKSYNSLDFVLNKLGLVNGYSAGINSHIGDRVLIKINFILTKKGLDNIDLILTLLYKYIGLIKEKITSGDIKKLYDEYIIINKNDFTYKTTMADSDTVLEFVHLILSYKIDIDKILVYDSIKNDFKYVNEKLTEIIESINLENSVIIYGTFLCINECNKTDKFYGTRYSLSEIKYKIRSDIQSDSLQLQQENKYIPLGFDLIKTPKKITTPFLIGHDIYYYPCTYFNLPLVNVDICIDLYNLMENNLVYLGTMFYLNIFFDRIKPENYLMHLAGYDVNVTIDNSKLIISIAGYSDKIYNVVKFLFDELVKFNYIDEQIFNRTHDTIKMINENSKMNPPYIQINEIFYKNALKKYYAPNDILNNLDKITINNMIEISKYMFSNIKISGLLAGNISKECSLNINNNTEKLKNYLCNQKSLIKKRACNGFIDISKQLYDHEIITINTNSENVHEKNNCVNHFIYLFDVKYVTGNDWNFNIAIADVLNTIMGEQFYSNLRTKEQFGYVVNTKTETIGQITNLSFYIKFVVQSSAKSIDDISNRINKFITEFLEYLKSMTDKDLGEFIDGRKETYLYEPQDLDEITEDYFNQIVINYTKFDYKKKMVDGYNEITKTKIIDFFNDKFINNKRGYIISIKNSV